MVLAPAPTGPLLTEVPTAIKLSPTGSMLRSDKSFVAFSDWRLRNWRLSAEGVCWLLATFSSLVRSLRGLAGALAFLPELAEVDGLNSKFSRSVSPLGADSGSASGWHYTTNGCCECTPLWKHSSHKSKCLHMTHVYLLP